MKALVTLALALTLFTSHAAAQAPWVQCEDLGAYPDGKHQLECYRDTTSDPEEWLTGDRAQIVRYYAPMQVIFEEVKA